ncbi:MAG: hypothetical protein ACPLZ9_01705, partial [Candidatus Ratteibacteria bacterium]
LADLYLNNYSKVNKKSYRRDITSIKNLNTFFNGKYVYEITGIDIENYKNRFDIVIECAGVESTLNLAEEIVNKAGKIAIFSWHHGKRIINANLWHSKGLHILNPSPVMGIKRNVDNFEKGIKLLESGKFNLEKLITHRFPVKEIDKAMKTAIEKPEGVIKVVLIFD